MADVSRAVLEAIDEFNQAEGTSVPVAAGQYAIELEYQPAGPDPEPVVGGQVMAQNGEALSGYSIEFVNAEARPPWRSGKAWTDWKPAAEARWANLGHRSSSERSAAATIAPPRKQSWQGPSSAWIWKSSSIFVRSSVEAMSWR